MTRSCSCSPACTPACLFTSLFTCQFTSLFTSLYTCQFTFMFFTVMLFLWRYFSFANTQTPLLPFQSDCLILSLLLEGKARKVNVHVRRSFSQPCSLVEDRQKANSKEGRCRGLTESTQHREHAVPFRTNRKHTAKRAAPRRTDRKHTAKTACSPLQD